MTHSAESSAKTDHNGSSQDCACGFPRSPLGACPNAACYHCPDHDRAEAIELDRLIRRYDYACRTCGMLLIVRSENSTALYMQAQHVGHEAAVCLNPACENHTKLPDKPRRRTLLEHLGP